MAYFDVLFLGARGWKEGGLFVELCIDTATKTKRGRTIPDK